ncbi:MAG: hypothetical protein ABSB95_05725 [Dissulfurispiraceae bacterium]|jgi:hypothetical protein
MRIRNSFIWVLGVLLLVLTGFTTQSSAGVNLNIGVEVAAPPPPYAFAAAPDVVVIPGTYVYMVPGIDADIMFYSGFWWRPFEGRWYRAGRYNGPWTYVVGGRVPHALMALPHGYRDRIRGISPIPHGQLQKNWRGWEKNKHWEQDKGWREGREGRGKERR